MTHPVDKAKASPPIPGFRKVQPSKKNSDLGQYSSKLAAYKKDTFSQLLRYGSLEQLHAAYEVDLPLDLAEVQNNDGTRSSLLGYAIEKRNRSLVEELINKEKCDQIKIRGIRYSFKAYSQEKKLIRFPFLTEQRFVSSHDEVKVFFQFFLKSLIEPCDLFPDLTLTKQAVIISMNDDKKLSCLHYFFQELTLMKVEDRKEKTLEVSLDMLPLLFDKLQIRQKGNELHPAVLLIAQDHILTDDAKREMMMRIGLLESEAIDVVVRYQGRKLYCEYNNKGESLGSSDLKRCLQEVFERKMRAMDLPITENLGEHPVDTIPILCRNSYPPKIALESKGLTFSLDNEVVPVFANRLHNKFELVARLWYKYHLKDWTRSSFSIPHERLFQFFAEEKIEPIYPYGTPPAILITQNATQF